MLRKKSLLIRQDRTDALLLESCRRSEQRRLPDVKPPETLENPRFAPAATAVACPRQFLLPGGERRAGIQPVTTVEPAELTDPRFADRAEPSREAMVALPRQAG